jgi:hypothetical protein
MECSHESARKACVCVPHAHDLIYEALVLTRIYVADDHTEIGAQRWNLTNLHTLPLCPDFFRRMMYDGSKTTMQKWTFVTL